jgi:hypothetical protein
MAKTVKRENKPKTTSKKNETIKEIVANGNINTTAIENDADEPVLVNEKNEIIYDPQADLKKVMDSIETNIPTDFIEDDVKEGINFLKNNVSIPTNLGSDIDKNLDFVEKQMEELNKIKDNLTKNTSSRSNFNFTSFWNGTTNKW